MVSEAGIIPLPRHVDAVRLFPPPSDIKHLQQFLGMINFYRRFIPSVAKVLKPLTDMLKGSPKSLAWSPVAATSFQAAKDALVAAVPLSHPAPGAALSLAVDASDSHVGGVLQQLQGRHWRPLAFFSAKLSETQARYSTFDRELLAAHSAVRHFRFLLEGCRFHIQTDHKPLVAAMTRVSPPWSGRQQRQLAYLSEFTADFRHTPGTENVVADTLSRPSTTTPAAQAPVTPAPRVSAPSAAPNRPVAAQSASRAVHRSRKGSTVGFSHGVPSKSSSGTSTGLSPPSRRPATRSGECTPGLRQAGHCAVVLPGRRFYEALNLPQCGLQVG
jgi:hypothetical protein